MELQFDKKKEKRKEKKKEGKAANIGLVCKILQQTKAWMKNNLYITPKHQTNYTFRPKVYILFCDGFSRKLGEREKKNIRLRGFEDETNTNYDEG